MNRLILIFFFCTIGQINAEISLKGSMSGNLYPNIFNVPDNIKVFEKLTLNSGTTIKLFKESYIDTRVGQIEIKGTKKEPVVFKNSNDSLSIVIDTNYTLKKLLIKNDSEDLIYFNNQRINKNNGKQSINIADIYKPRERSKAHTPIMIISGISSLAFGSLAIANLVNKKDKTLGSSEFDKHAKKFNAFLYLSGASILTFTIDVIIKRELDN